MTSGSLAGAALLCMLHCKTCRSDTKSSVYSLLIAMELALVYFCNLLDILAHFITFIEEKSHTSSPQDTHGDSSQPWHTCRVKNPP